MTWTRGYVRLDDRVAAPHPALRRRTAFVLFDVARTTRARVDEELGESGLTWLLFSLLLVAGEIDGLSQQALAQRAGADRNRTSAALADLEYEGMVARERSRADGRRTVVDLTPSGRALLAEATPGVERAERAALKGLDRRERERLHSLLDRLVRDDTPAWFKRF